MTKTQTVMPGQYWRVYLVYFLLLLCVALVAWKLSAMQFTEREFLRGQGQSRTIRTPSIPAHRGIITDRNGEPLAVTTPVQSIAVKPRQIMADSEAVARLAVALNMNPQILANTISNNAGRSLLYVKRHLPPVEADRILAMGIPGVTADAEYQRYYPHGEVTAHMVGFSNVDDEGQEGLEYTYDKWLRGVPGSRRVVIDLHGNIIEELGIINTAVPGNDLQLSIDFRLQNLAYKELKAEFLNRRARSASVVVLDVDTGEVLALANQPSYNPNNKNNLSDYGVLRNRAVIDPFEPGSTAKVFTAAAALETGLYRPDTLVDTSPGWMMLDGYEVREHGLDYGILSLEGILTKSSNVGSTRIALDIGHEPIRDVLERVGFGQTLGTGFPAEHSGVLRNNPRWSRIEVANMSFGYGFTTTALQLAQAYTVLAAGGVKRPVSLLKIEPDAVADIPNERVFSAQVSAQVLAMMESVVDPSKGGTATEANVPFYRVAGKTGTAEVHSESNGYQDDVHRSMFVGLAPASDPEIVVMVVISEPKGDEQYGGQVAAPVFSRIVSGAMRILNVSPDNIDASENLILTSN